MQGYAHGLPQLHVAEEQTSLQEPHLAGMAVVQVAPELRALLLHLRLQESTLPC